MEKLDKTVKTIIHRSKKGVRTNFRNDLAEASMIEQLLDTEIYSQLFSETDRRADRTSQFAGIDLICDGYKVDEKAQIAYKNNPIPTQVLEISFLSKSGNKARKRGWFIDKNLETEYYMFVFFPQVEGVEKRWDKISSIDQIQKMEIMYVNKQELMDTVQSYASIRDIAQTAQQMRDGELNKVEHINGLKLMLSDRLAEKPVNIVFKKHLFPLTIHATWTRGQGLHIIQDNR